MALRVEIDHANEKKRSVQELPEKEVPDFAEYEPDIEKIIEEAGKQDYDNLVVIGNGGSITSFTAYIHAFPSELDMNVETVTSMDPDFLHSISRRMRPENTLVMPISKSGETVGVIESLLYFMERDYPVYAVTSDNDGALKQIVERNGYDWFEHPEIGGRFSGMTETALVPAAFAGLDIRELREGAEEMYGKLSPENNYNPALNLASALYGCEKDGYGQVFAGFYSVRMYGIYPLCLQLMHETVCKEGEGQTVFGELGPEFQHHTNQRIFGGEENILPLFFRSEAHNHETVHVSEELRDIGIREEELGGLEGESYQEALKSEYMGVKKELDEKDRPNITLSVTDVSYRGIGKIVAFLQYLAVYSAWLRDVDPFTQPDVEKSKEISMEERFNP